MGQHESKMQETVESKLLARDTNLILGFNVSSLRKDISNSLLQDLINYFCSCIPNADTQTQRQITEYIQHLSGCINKNPALQLRDFEIDHLLKQDIFKRIWIFTFSSELNHTRLNINLPRDSLISPALIGLVHIQVGQQLWKRVFTSSQGKSFTLLLQMLNTCNESLIIIKDSKGKIFGFYTFDAFDSQPKFYGSSSNFLFTQEPLRLYNTTGYNCNYLYFNHGQKTMINGIGLGGQLDYFGLYISEDFTGHSRAEPKSTTYGNPPLSGSQEFDIDIIEIYQMAVKEAKQEKSSVLDDYAAMNFLEVSGRKMYSKDVH